MFRRAQKWSRRCSQFLWSVSVEHASALVKFGETTPDSVLVVTLQLENGVWCFEDLNKPSRGSFEALSKSNRIKNN